MKRVVSSLVLVGWLLVGFGVHEPVYGKTVADPNHKGFTGKHPRSKQVKWKPIKAKCEKCSKMVEQYNNTMMQLLESRYWVNFWREVKKNREKGKKDPFWPGKGDITEFEGKAVGANLELMELQNAQLAIHRKRVVSLEKQASYLRGVIMECEATACGKAKEPKLKNIKIGGEQTKQPFQPDTKSILDLHGVEWSGPYTTDCKTCVPIVKQLNAVPGWIARAHFKLKNAEEKLAIKKMIEASNKITLEFLKYTHPDKANYSGLQAEVEQYRKEIEALKKVFKQLLKDKAACEKKYCEKLRGNVSTEGSALIGMGPPDVCTRSAANESIEIGANAEVGSSANFKEKAKKKVTGAAVGAVAKLIGIGGGGGKSKGPTTYKDPIKNKRKTRVRDKKAKRDFYAGGAFTPDGLLISSAIKKAPGKGTFHTVYIENERGWRLTPVALYMYEIWRDWKLSVSWTRDTYVDGELVKHEEGGWTESWRELIASGEETLYGRVPISPLWEQLGFNTAVSGARSLGTLFPVSPQMLSSETWNLVVHVSDPKKDPVVTVPYVFALDIDDDGKVIATLVDQTMASDRANCDDYAKLNSGTL